MNRRSFLKFFGITAAATALPSIAVEALTQKDEWKSQWDSFDPNGKYGNWVSLSEPLNLKDPGTADLKIFKIIEENMRNVIPPNYWNKVKYIQKTGSGGTVDPFYELTTICWRYG